MSRSSETSSQSTNVVRNIRGNITTLNEAGIVRLIIIMLPLPHVQAAMLVGNCVTSRRRTLLIHKNEFRGPEPYVASLHSSSHEEFHLVVDHVNLTLGMKRLEDSLN